MSQTTDTPHCAWLGKTRTQHSVDLLRFTPTNHDQTHFPIAARLNSLSKPPPDIITTQIYHHDEHRRTLPSMLPPIANQLPSIKPSNNLQKSGLPSKRKLDPVRDPSTPAPSSSVQPFLPSISLTPPRQPKSTNPPKSPPPPPATPTSKTTTPTPKQDPPHPPTTIPQTKVTTARPPHPTMKRMNRATTPTGVSSAGASHAQNARS
jgi:hypothetical protein